MFLFGDGAVRLISNSIQTDPADLHTDYPFASTARFNYTLEKLVHPSDGQPIGNF